MTTAGNVRVNIGGDVSGQIAIGNNILQIQNNGGVVLVQPSSHVSFRPQTRPVSLRPRPYPALLDRELESSLIQTALQKSMAVSVFGEQGIGKTTFVSHMAHLPETNKFPDGVAYLYARNQGFDDLLQAIFDAFYLSDEGVMPTAGQIRGHLQSLKALIILDELGLARDDVQALLNVMPASCLIFASLSRSVWGEGQIIPLGGLPRKQQIELFERELGRTISDNERDEVTAICSLLHGHPFNIVQAASLVREKRRSLAQIAVQIQAEPAPLAITQQSLTSLDDSQKRVLAVLGATAGAPIPIAGINTLAQVSDSREALTSLAALGFVWVDGPGYGLTGALVDPIRQIWDLSSSEDALVNYFDHWLSQNPGDDLIDQVWDALAQVIQKAGEKKSWPEVIRIGRALERILILRKRWQAWLNVLNLIRKAAQALGDQSTEAWALHQLGSRAMCLSFSEQAREFLTQALNIRQAIGDQAGLAVTQHNLNVLFHPPLDPTAGKSFWRRCFNCGCGGAVGLAGLGAIILVVAAVWPHPSPVEPDERTRVTPSYTRPPAQISTFTPIPTFTPSVTPTVTPHLPMVLYDFVELASKAVWESEFFDVDGTSVDELDFWEDPYSPAPEDYVSPYEKSYAGWEYKTGLEDGSIDPLIVDAFPYPDGYKVRGTYDLSYLIIQPGDRFEARVGFKDVAFQGFIIPAPDGVTFQLYFYEKDSSDAILLAELEDWSNQKLHDWLVPLKKIVGRSGRFVLVVDSGDNANYDWAVWINAVLIGLPR